MASWRGALKTRMSGLASGRVYWGERPQTSGLPALRVKVITDGRPQTLKDWDLAPGRVRFDAFGRTPEAAWQLIEDTITALVPGGTYSGHNFQRADVDIGPHDLEDDTTTTDVFGVSMDLIFHHTEGAVS